MPSHAVIRWAGAVLVTVLVCASPAAAQSSASDAYDRGVAAHDRGDFAKAAAEFARADELTPSPIALQAALDAAIQADDPALGAELLERSKRESPSGELAKTIAAAHAKFDGRAGSVQIGCTGCRILIDDREVDPKKTAWTTTGKHIVVRELDGRSETIEVDVKPREVSRPFAETRSASPSPSKLPPWVFWAAAGATVVAGAMTIGFGLSANSRHSDFEAAGCDRAAVDLNACAAQREDGQAADARTNVALVTTLLFGAATAVVGLYFTRWTF